MATNYGHGVYAVDETSPISRLRVGESGEIGIVGTAPAADAEKWPLDEPIALRGDLSIIESLGMDGTLPLILRTIWAEYEKQSPQIAIVRVEEDNDSEVQTAKVIGDAAAYTGVYALLTCNEKIGFEPDLLIAPGFDMVTAEAANPVVSALVSVAGRMRSYVFASGPNDTSEAALAAAKHYGSDRLDLVDPFAVVYDTRSGGEVPLPGSAIYAAVQSRTDLEKGFWWSYDNKPAKSVLGIGRPIAWRTGDKGCEAVQLNLGRVGSFIRENGWRCYSGGSTDRANKFGGTIVGRRVADKVYDTLERGLHALVGQPINESHFAITRALVTNFLTDLEARGAIVGWGFEFHPELNAVEKLAEGEVYWRLSFQEAASARQIEIYGRRDAGLYREYLTEQLMVQAA